MTNPNCKTKKQKCKQNYKIVDFVCSCFKLCASTGTLDFVHLLFNMVRSVYIQFDVKKMRAVRSRLVPTKSNDKVSQVIN